MSKGKKKIKSGSGKFQNRKNSKQIPFSDYKWPETNNPGGNPQRPITANYGRNEVVRPATNYDAKRKEIQSRGKAVATELSGISQDELPEGSKLQGFLN